MSTRTRKIALYGLGLAVLCLVITFFVFSLSRPYMGVDIRLRGEAWVVVSVDPSGLAHAAGIKPGDTVTAVNGEDPAEFAATSDKLPIVRIETLSVVDAGGTSRFVSTYESPIPTNTLIEAVSLFFIGLVFLGTGGWVLIKKPDAKGVLQLYLFCLAVSVACVAWGVNERGIAGARHIEIVNGVILVPLFLHFCLTFPKSKELKAGSRDILGIIYLPALVILVIYGLFGHNMEALYSWFRPLIFLYLMVGFLLGLGSLIHSYFTATYGRIKQQTKIIMSGAVTGVLPFVLLSVIPEALTGSTWVAPQFTILGIIFIPLALAYTIVRHQLLDIDFYLSRALVYGLITLALVAAYILVTFSLTQITGSLTGTQHMAIIIALSCLALLLFPLVKARIQHRVDQVFYKDRYDYRQSLRSISVALSSSTDLDILSNFIVSSISKTLGLSEACLFIRDETGKLQLSQSSGIYEGWERLNELPGQIETLKEEDKFPEKAPANLGVEFVVPLKSGDQEMGVLCLGRKVSRAGFSVDDIYFVATFATQAAAAIEKAILLEKGRERERQMQQELIISSRLASIGKLAAGVAHELSNPLTAVVGFSQILLDRDVPEDIKEDLEMINEQAERVAKIVSNLLTFARQSKAEVQYIDINSIISRVLEMRAYEMRVNNIQVTTQFDSDLPRTMADIGQLQQVFLNIIINAEQAMTKAHRKGKLSIKTEHIESNGSIIVSIADDGPGIAKGNLDKIFDPFFTTKSAGEGTGLGLSICHGIIKAHNGRIYAKSKSGKGATFFVELPIVTKSEQLKFAELPEEESQRATRARIMVLDDEPSVCQFLSQALTEEGHNVETINNASAALERLKHEGYNLILLDIKMPGMDGIEFYKQVKKISPSLQRRVVFITGDIMSPNIQNFLDKTKAYYLSKPFDVEQLKKDINQILLEIM
jgi:signal transduction histidine kinase/CheY-like chemotaxis protein